MLLEICVNVLVVSFTSVVAMGSVFLISCMVMILFGKDTK